ncbi:MAG: GGDEF domain-containing protein [Sphingomonadales bacterium]|nr:GGDEF domain-containing protein [Sphingomonadales bacterium]
MQPVLTSEGSSKTAFAALVRDGTFVTLGIAMAAILLLVGTGSTWAQSIFVPGFDITQSHAVVASSLILNIALVLLCWRRYRDLAAEVELRRNGEERALDMAQRDSLTGLLNRRAITGQGSAAIQAWPARGDLVAAYMIDIDSFKSVNDLFGHAEGDAVISEVAARLERAMPSGALLARIGGDEFVAMIPLTHGIDIAADAFGEQMVQILSVPLVAPGRSAGVLLDRRGLVPAIDGCARRSAEQRGPCHVCGQTFRPVPLRPLRCGDGRGDATSRAHCRTPDRRGGGWGVHPGV